MWRRDCTARQRPVPVTSIPIPPGPWTCCLCTVQYCTVHTVLYRGEMSGQCQPSVRPLCSGYHCRWHMDELLISSCNHNLVFVNLYDDIHQRQYSEKAPTTAHFILERSGVLSTRRIIGTFSKCCVLQGGQKKGRSQNIIVFHELLSLGCINFKNLCAYHEEEVLRFPKHPQLTKFAWF